MLEECRLPYVVRPVNIGAGDQFKPSFLKISPNNRMPAIIDPDGPGGRPISIFESGAIFQYLGNKTGKFYPRDWRRRVKVDEWLHWQMGNLGPMAGQAHHFLHYKKPRVKYAAERYMNEVNRLYGVMNGQLRSRRYLAGAYSIADMACWGWVLPWKTQGQNLAEFKYLKDWFDRVSARPAVQRGFNVGIEWRQRKVTKEEEAKSRKILFGHRARK